MSKQKKASKVPAGVLAMTPAQIEARQLLRRSGAAGAHGGRRPRAAVKRQALRDQGY